MAVTWQDEEVTNGPKEETTGGRARRAQGRAILEQLGLHSQPIREVQPARLGLLAVEPR